ncbi:hypothetical protein RchiOBHm_Chr5g0050351 [Rosa chinensis]|uniref:Uncharacterized protein n=1 Tax=Rosa chinensis TaxID=74649 RepID=A0A2P6QF27_ROSCH|nr:hypothetical protein RchiOBHm_Chr5g0050351 [Rosa chinensis]
MGQTSVGATSSGSQGSLSGRSSTQPGRGQRGRPVTQARLHAMTQQEGRTAPNVIMGRTEPSSEEDTDRQQG